VNMLNRHSRAADSGWSSNLEVGRGAKNCSPRKRISVAKHSQTKPRTRTDTLVRPKQRKRDMRFCNADVQEVGCEGVNWIKLAQDRDKWRSSVNAVMSLRIS
jgi:predicted membrane-bound mannosyltransferase